MGSTDMISSEYQKNAIVLRLNFKKCSLRASGTAIQYPRNHRMIHSCQARRTFTALICDSGLGEFRPY